ncbi:HemK2/MTQ2 family protein methyltransferase [Dietzia maris]|uniref:HemK2/MTQ2 family protein methyltransferase n=1 Tax=Dietzia maris TaxID=37915 RepID=UPI0037CB5D95
MTQTRFTHIEVDDGVYAPQDDSWLICEALDQCDLVAGRRVLDICTGSGILAIETALKGAREVFAYDISPAAVACASRNADRAGVQVDVRLGTLDDARRAGPYDVVVSNPPYVPSDAPLEGTGPNRAWDAGSNGRVVLDQLCDLAPDLVSPGGSMMIVHSEFSDPPQTIRKLEQSGFTARAVATRVVDFGPVMTSYAERLEAAGLLEPGRREEELVVIRVDRV